jgi:hypothetical protein
VVTIYRVEYPFEIDAERGSESAVYPSLRAALKDARSLYAGRIRGELEGEFPEFMLAAHLPAGVVAHRVVRLTAAAVCEVINGGGAHWSESAEPVGTIAWVGGRLKLVRLAK